ncbi:MAG: addiction module antitoxin RelB [Gammaproteobacteria bacterium]|nr:MAG: addiction module antitoxin RelB [Gammaproteobacteria bacterium]
MLQKQEFDKINIADKFQIMEDLWQNLSQNAHDNGFSPQWHIDVLEQRERGIKTGDYKFSPLSDAKIRLKDI